MQVDEGVITLSAVVVAGLLFARMLRGKSWSGAVMGNQVSMVSPGVAKEWVEAGEAVVIDVREPSEYQAGHIPGAILDPLSVFDPAKVPEPGEKKLIFHCQRGMRCGPAAAHMIQSGYKGTIFRLEGGFAGWVSAGGRVEQGG